MVIISGEWTNVTFAVQQLNIFVFPMKLLIWLKTKIFSEWKLQRFVQIIFWKHFLKLNTRTEIVKIIATIVVTIAAVAVEITTAVVVVATETAVVAEAETETKVAKTDTELEKVKTHCPAHLIGQFRNIVHCFSPTNWSPHLLSIFYKSSVWIIKARDRNLRTVHFCPEFLLNNFSFILSILLNIIYFFTRQYYYFFEQNCANEDLNDQFIGFSFSLGRSRYVQCDLTQQYYIQI